MSKLTIYCDGGARGNPGPGAIGIAIYQDNNLIKSISKFVGLKVTNNQAEYLALIESLQQARNLDATEVQLFVDSQLVEKQLKGEYKVKNTGLKKLHQEAQNLIRQFGTFTITHVKRGKNKLADKLVNQALDRTYS